jgi:predicted DNA-binding transcriptional regulator AlpA
MKTGAQIVDPDRLLSSREACALLACSKVSLWRWMRHPDFPRALRFSPGNSRSRLRFVRSQLLDWAFEQQRLTAVADASSEPRGIHASAAAAGD